MALHDNIFPAWLQTLVSAVCHRTVYVSMTRLKITLGAIFQAEEKANPTQLYLIIHSIYISLIQRVPWTYKQHQHLSSPEELQTNIPYIQQT